MVYGDSFSNSCRTTGCWNIAQNIEWSASLCLKNRIEVALDRRSFSQDTSRKRKSCWWCCGALFDRQEAKNKTQRTAKKPRHNAARVRTQKRAKQIHLGDVAVVPLFVLPRSKELSQRAQCAVEKNSALALLGLIQNGKQRGFFDDREMVFLDGTALRPKANNFQAPITSFNFISSRQVQSSSLFYSQLPAPFAIRVLVIWE